MLSYKNKKIYFGDLHCHTGFSDGKQTPKEAFLKARAEGNLDFMAITDHAASITVEKFLETQKAAQECTTDDFVAIAGCENGFDDSYTNEYHIPVLNGGELITFSSNTWCSESDCLENFTDILSNHGQAIAGFAHPQEASWPTEKLWNGYNMAHHRSEKVRSFVRMIEVCNETSAYNLIHEKLYATALDCGFRVSAIAVSDTHEANWGSAKLRARTALYLEELTLESVLSALRNQRGYATEIPDAILGFWVNGVFMGGDIPQTTSYQMHIEIIVPEESEKNKLAKIQIISDYGMTLYEIEPYSYKAELEPIIKTDSARYFYVRALTVSGERIWSSPIWTGREFDEEKEKEDFIKLDKTHFQISSSDSPETVQNLCNNNPNLPWKCTCLNSCAVIDLGKAEEISAIGYHRHSIPYNNLKAVKALLNRYCYQLSLDGENFFASYEGVITNYGSEQIKSFPAVSARYIKIKAISSVGSDAFDSQSFPIIGEISIYRSKN